MIAWRKDAFCGNREWSRTACDRCGRLLAEEVSVSPGKEQAMRLLDEFLARAGWHAGEGCPRQILCPGCREGAERVSTGGEG